MVVFESFYKILYKIPTTTFPHYLKV